jgi:hypothetical protein
MEASDEECPCSAHGGGARPRRESYSRVHVFQCLRGGRRDRPSRRSRVHLRRSRSAGSVPRSLRWLGAPSTHDWVGLLPCVVTERAQHRLHARRLRVGARLGPRSSTGHRRCGPDMVSRWHEARLRQGGHRTPIRHIRRTSERRNPSPHHLHGDRRVQRQPACLVTPRTDRVRPEPRGWQLCRRHRGDLARRLRPNSGARPQRIATASSRQGGKRHPPARTSTSWLETTRAKRASRASTR